MSVVAKDVDILVLNSSFKPFENIKIRRTFGSMWQREGVTSGSKIHVTKLLAGVEKGFANPGESQRHRANTLRLGSGAHNPRQLQHRHREEVSDP